MIAADSASTLPLASITGDLPSVIQRLVLGNRALPKARPERLPFQEFEDDKQVSLMSANIVSGDHIRVIQRAHRFGFLIEPLPPSLIRREVGIQNLQRNNPVESAVAASVDLSHTALTEQPQNFVRS